MDIQEERRKTAEARKDAEAAKAQAEEAKAQAEEARKEVRKEAVKNAVLLCRKFGASREKTAQELVNLYDMDPASAQEAVTKYWD